MPSSQPTRGDVVALDRERLADDPLLGEERAQPARQHLLVHPELEERVADGRHVETAVALAELVQRRSAGRGSVRPAHDSARSAISASSSARCSGSR